jgi:hypothetical protein
MAERAWVLALAVVVIVMTQASMLSRARADSLFDSAHLSGGGELRQEIAYRYVDPASFTKVRFQALLHGRYAPHSAFSLVGSVRAYYDAVYDIESVDSIVMRRDPEHLLPDFLTPEQIEALQVENLQGADIRQHDIELRDLYAEVRRPQWELRLGHQIVRWNVLEGSRVVDEINPLDFREFILPTIVERSIPLWMLRVDYYPNDWTVEGLWIPDLKFHEPAPKGSEWEQLQTLENLDKPPKTVANSEWALKVSGTLGTWGVSLSYFDTWDDFPTAFRTIESDEIFGAPPEVTFHPTATRLHIIGSTLTNSLGSVIVSAEAAYVMGKYFGLTLPPFDPVTGQFVGGTPDQNLTGEAKTNYVKYALGADTRLFGTDYSLQMQQEIIPQYTPEIIQDQVSTIFGVFVRRELWYGTMTAEALILYFVNENGWLGRPKATWRLTDNLKLAVGADLFKGTIGGPLPGEFNFAGFFVNHGRVYTELSYSF